MEKRLSFVIFFLIACCIIPHTALGAPKLSWDPSTGDVTGYKIYYGESSGSYSQQMDVGNHTECALSDLSIKDGAQYHFAVKAYNGAGESDFSNEVSWESGDSTPPITPQGFSVNVEPGQATLKWQLNSENDLNGYYAYCGDSSRAYGPPIPVGNTTTCTVSNLEEGKLYYFAVSANDTSGNESGYSNEVAKEIPQTQATPPPPDQAPGDLPEPDTELISNLSVTSGKSYVLIKGLKNGQACYIDRGFTYKNIPEELVGSLFIKTANDDKWAKESDFITFDLSADSSIYIAHDNRLKDKPTWLSEFKDTGKDLSTDVPLSIFTKDFKPGKVILGGNVGGSTSSMYTIAIMAKPTSGTDPEPTGDEIAPTLSILSPISQGTYTTKSAAITLSGEAQDNIGVSKVTWNNSRGGNGVAVGTSDWTISSVSLLEGDNTISVAAEDAAGNSDSKQIIVSYNPPDTTPPTINITSPTSEPTYRTNASTLTISGTASDNAGINQVVWTNSTGDSGTASGTSAWTMSGITLKEGVNIITVKATDNSENEGIASLTAEYAPVVAPPTNDSPLTISNLTVTSGKSYEVDNGLGNNMKCYIDRNFTYKNVPDELVGATFIKTANNDKYAKDSDFITFNISTDSMVYVAYDNRLKDKPSWLSQFKDTGKDLSTDVSMSIFSKDFQAGKVTLGGNVGGVSSSMYTIAIKKISTSGTEPDPSVDNIVPTLSILSPISQGTYTTKSASIDLSGEAHDDIGVTRVTWSNSRGGSGLADDTTDWTILSVNLLEGDNTINVKAEDAAGNIVSKQIVVNYTPQDTTSPTISITSPTSEPTYTTKGNTLNIGGTASDNLGIAKVMWGNSGGDSGTAIGTVNWAVTGIALKEGKNLITITAFDNAGNEADKSLVVDYTPVSPPVDDEALIISNFTVASGKPYTVMKDLQNGVLPYIDRNYTYNNIPEFLTGATYIKTANDDKTKTNDQFISFDSNKKITIYIAYDNRLKERPNWLSSFSDTGSDITTNVPMSLYSANFPQGKIVLGGNSGISLSNMYSVIIK